MRDAPAPVLARRLGFMLAGLVAAALVAAGTSRSGIGWLLLAAQVAIAAAGTWLLSRSWRRIREADQRAADRAQALLERLSIATQAAGIYCWELDWKTYTITWDESRLPAAEAAAASRRHFGAELGSDLFKWVHPDDQHAGSKAMSDSLARGDDHVAFRYRIVLPDRSIRHIQAFARTYCDAAGRPYRSLGVSWDVTQEVEAAERAARDAAKERELLERLSLATHAVGLQCWEYDAAQARLLWLDYDQSDGRRTPAELQEIGAARYASILPGDRRAVQELASAAQARREPMITARYRRRDADGSLRYVQTYQRFFYDDAGRLLRTLGANIDITESYERQAELEALSIRFEIATRAAQAGVWEWQERSGALWWNDTVYAIHGLAPGAEQPDFARAVAMIHPDDVPVAHAAWVAALEGSGQLHVQFRIVRPDGTIAHVDQLAVLVTDAHTGERRMVGITRDVSTRVAAEQRERELQQQLRDASHRSGMAEVATGVLHNVGNVLNSLGVSSSTLQSRLRASSFDRVERIAELLAEHRDHLDRFLVHDPRGRQLPEYLAALGQQLRRDADGLRGESEVIARHVHYLREVVRAQQSYARGGGAPEAVAVHELIDAALTLKGRELDGVAVVRDLAELPPLWTERYKLLQIVVNFLANAADAVAECAPGERRILIRARRDGDQLEIAVEDSGVGIAAEHLQRVWEFGFTTKPAGHGFGLHSSAVAAQQLGGSVTAASPGPGRGARFAVRIPIVAPERAGDSAGMLAARPLAAECAHAMLK